MNDELFGNKPSFKPESGNFASIIDGSFSSDGNAVIRAAVDSGYYISANIKNDNGKNNIWLSFIDTTAERKWSALLESADTDDRVSRIEVIDKDNLFIFADRYYSDTTGLYPDILIIKVNSSQGIVWQRCLGNTDKNLIHSSVLTDDGGLLAAGVTVTPATDADPAVYNPFIVKIDSDGFISWGKDYRNLNNAEAPLGIISLGDEEYLLTGTSQNPDNGKINVFYCRIDGSNDASQGKILKSKKVKSTAADIYIIGNVNNDLNITSVIGLEYGSSEELGILVMDKEKLKVSSAKNYLFPDFQLYGEIVNVQSDGFLLAGMVNYSAGKGIYSISFDMSGSIQDLQTKYYDSTGYYFVNPRFNIINPVSEITFISFLDNHTDDKDLFIDKFETSKSSKIISSSDIKIQTKEDSTDTGEVEEEDVDVVMEDSVIVNKSDPGLVFKRY